MKRILLCLLIALCAISANAQNLQEVVYLKNGSMIRGVVLEQIPNETIKVQTADGSVFVYKMEEVEKITKEAINNSNTQTFNNYQTTNNQLKLEETSLSYPNKGYRGFVSIGTGFATDESLDYFLFSVSTSHGAQIARPFFLGGGLGLESYGGDALLVPIFTEVRFDFVRAAVSPFLSFRLGYSVGDNN